MELTRQWGTTKTCPDFGTVEAGNIKVFSHDAPAEREACRE